jgi:glutaredoxin
MLDARSIAYDEVASSPRRLRAVSARASTPQVFIDGSYVGGADELEKWLSARA